MTYEGVTSEDVKIIISLLNKTNNNINFLPAVIFKKIGSIISRVLTSLINSSVYDSVFSKHREPFDL